ncbi:hypothetical protein DL93DRAFT_2226292 [Clavulina sp. PMI_390]|nr:hypothetical protein DL93DRAFT_2226292 [Clavulina sp. PMI_390]
MLRALGLVALSLLPATLAQISNDFESGWDQTTWPIYAPDCNQGGTVALDSTVAHSGTHSMKVTGAGGYCGHIFFGTTSVPSGNVYVRVWLQTTTALTSNHVSFMIMPDSSQGTGENLRVGGQDQILMYNRESDDATMPDMSPQGTAASVPLPVNSWQCLEYHLGTDGTIETWLNSNLISGMTIYPGVTNPDATQFQRSTYIPKITGVYFGWESYGGDVNTFWYDDISIQSSRIGCGTGSTGGSTSTTSSTHSTSTSSATKTTTATANTTIKTTTTSTKTTTSTASVSTCTTAKYGQCGGIGYTGCTTCASGSTCTYSNAYYSQCL